MPNVSFGKIPYETPAIGEGCTPSKKGTTPEPDPVADDDSDSTEG